MNHTSRNWSRISVYLWLQKFYSCVEWLNCVCTCASVKIFHSSTARVSFLYNSEDVSHVVNAASHKLHTHATTINRTRNLSSHTTRSPTPAAVAHFTSSYATVTVFVTVWPWVNAYWATVIEYICVPSLLLITQATFLLDCRHTHQITFRVRAGTPQKELTIWSWD